MRLGHVERGRERNAKGGGEYGGAREGGHWENQEDGEGLQED